MRRLPEEGDVMTAQSWPESVQKVADIVRENEVLKWELVKVKDENAKLKKECKKLKQWAEECKKSFALTMDETDCESNENTELTRALERACEWILKSANRKCEGCPVRAIPEPCQLGKCKETIIRYFKEPRNECN
jgi:hypothetical protein